MPEVITEDDFWRNYFYRIECRKKDLGLKTRLGAMIPRAARAQKLEQLQVKIDKEVEADEEAVRVSTETLRSS